LNKTKLLSPFHLVFAISVLLALGIGYFAGVQLNPKPKKIIVEKTIENKIIEKKIPVKVVVEKHVNLLPNFIVSDGVEHDCHDAIKLQLMPPRSKWKPIERTEVDLKEDSYFRARTAEREAMYHLGKLLLLRKIQCRADLNDSEFELLTELVNRPDT
jgi:hypothetical protein